MNNQFNGIKYVYDNSIYKFFISNLSNSSFQSRTIHVDFGCYLIKCVQVRLIV